MIKNNTLGTDMQSSYLMTSYSVSALSWLRLAPVAEGRSGDHE